MKYPTPLKMDSGCKVGWLTYGTLAEARRASTIARREARKREKLGYEWGYSSPGAIREVGGVFVVTIP